MVTVTIEIPQTFVLIYLNFKEKMEIS